MGTKHYFKLYNKSKKWLITIVLSIIISINTPFASVTAFAANVDTKTSDSNSTSQSNPKSCNSDFAKSTTITDSKNSTTVTKTINSSSTTQELYWHHHHHHHHATVNVRYVDQTGQLLATGSPMYPNGPHIGQPYVTRPRHFDGYQFIRMGARSLPARGILRHHGDNGTVTYVYATAYHLSTKTINESVSYVDQDGEEIAQRRVSKPITFATVTDPFHHTTVTYYSTTRTSLTLDDAGAPVDASQWTKGNQAQFAAVPNPTIKGYHVTENEAPHSDSQQVAQQTVTADSSDLSFTVHYGQSSKKVTVKFVDDRTRKLLFSKDLQVYYNQKHLYDPTSKIKEYQKAGYTLTNNQFPEDGLDFDQIDGDSVVYYVHLRSKAKVTPPAATPKKPAKPSAPAPEKPRESKPKETPVKPAKPVGTPTAKPAQPVKTAAPTMEEKRIIVQKRLQQYVTHPAKPRPVAKKTPVQKKPAHVEFEFINQPPVPKKRWIKIPSYMHRYWKFPTFTTPFALWTSELQPLYRKTGGEIHYTQLGLILRTMSGRMLVGQKYSK